MPEEPDEITKLLRVKRFEQPPAEYFEKFLHEFQDRQRAQLLREPVWRIAWDRLSAFLGEQMPARIGYGLASTAVLVAAAIASFHILETPATEVASAPEQQPQQQIMTTTHPAGQIASLNLSPQAQLPDLPSIVSRTAPTASFSAPRYVMDARPVSYEPPSSF